MKSVCGNDDDFNGCSTKYKARCNVNSDEWSGCVDKYNKFNDQCKGSTDWDFCADDYNKRCGGKTGTDIENCIRKYNAYNESCKNSGNWQACVDGYDSQCRNSSDLAGCIKLYDTYNSKCSDKQGVEWNNCVDKYKKVCENSLDVYACLDKFSRACGNRQDWDTCVNETNVCDNYSIPFPNNAKVQELGKTCGQISLTNEKNYQLPNLGLKCRDGLGCGYDPKGWKEGDGYTVPPNANCWNPTLGRCVNKHFAQACKDDNDRNACITRYSNACKDKDPQECVGKLAACNNASDWDACARKSFVEYTKYKDVDSGDNDISWGKKSLEECRKECSQNDQCVGFNYHNDPSKPLNCYTKYALRSNPPSESYPGVDFYVKKQN